MIRYVSLPKTSRRRRPDRCCLSTTRRAAMLRCSDRTGHLVVVLAVEDKTHASLGGHINKYVYHSKLYLGLEPSVPIGEQSQQPLSYSHSHHAIISVLTQRDTTQKRNSYSCQQRIDSSIKKPTKLTLKCALGHK